MVKPYGIPRRYDPGARCGQRRRNALELRILAARQRDMVDADPVRTEPIPGWHLRGRGPKSKRRSSRQEEHEAGGSIACK